MTGCSTHQEGLAKRPRKPMRLTTSRQLVDRDSTVFLPGASGGHLRFVRRIGGQRVTKLTPAHDQAIQVGQVNLDLRLQAFIHWLRLHYSSSRIGRLTVGGGGDNFAAVQSTYDA